MRGNFFNFELNFEFINTVGMLKFRNRILFFVACLQFPKILRLIINDVRSPHTFEVTPRYSFSQQYYAKEKKQKICLLYVNLRNGFFTSLQVAIFRHNKSPQPESSKRGDSPQRALVRPPCCS